MTEFSDSKAVVQYLRENAPGNGMYFAKEGVLAAIDMTPEMSDKSQNMGPQLIKQFVICVIATELLAWLLLSTSIRTPIGAGAVFAIAGLAASVDASLSAWNWYNHSMGFAIGAIVGQVVGFFVAGLAVGWARGKFA